MNCKQGDIAIIIKGTSMGSLLECLKYLGGEERGYTEIWEVKTLSPAKASFPFANVTLPAGSIAHCPDSYMRPLRGDLTGEQDLYALPKPEPVEEKV